MEHARAGRTRRPAPTKTPETGRLIVVGESDRANAVVRALGDLAVDMARTSEVPAAAEPGTLGFVLVSPLPDGKSAARVTCDLRESKETDPIPVFAVIGDDVADNTVRRTYVAGATAVFQWPREALLLARLVAELLGVALVRGRAAKPQTALTRTLNAHLRLIPWITSGISVRTTADGEAILTGPVGTYRRKLELRRMTMGVPGVKRVDDSGLWVTPSGLSDRSVATAVRTVLRHTTAVDDGTVSVASHGGRVSVAGVAASRREARRILELVGQVNGVRDIDNSLVVSPPAKKKNRSTALRLNRLLTHRFPEERVHVSVFANVAVATGSTTSLSRKTEIEELIERDPAVERVLNKLEVAGD